MHKYFTSATSATGCGPIRGIVSHDHVHNLNTQQVPVQKVRCNSQTKNMSSDSQKAVGKLSPSSTPQSMS